MTTWDAFSPSKKRAALLLEIQKSKAIDFLSPHCNFQQYSSSSYTTSLCSMRGLALVRNRSLPTAELDNANLPRRCPEFFFDLDRLPGILSLLRPKRELSTPGAATLSGTAGPGL